MKSRYTFMKESSVIDKEDQQQYPDPLSISYNNYKPYYELISHEMTSTDLAKIFNMMQREYGVQELDDVLLSYNGVPYIGMLEPGNSIYLLKIEDLSKFS